MRGILSRRLPRRALHAALALASLSLFLPAISRAQPPQPTQMILCTVATQTDDAAALDKARQYLSDAKDKDSPVYKQERERAQGGLAPLFPNPEISQTVTSVELAAAMSLPQLGLGDSLLAMALLNQPARNAAASKEKPLAHRYRWVELKEHQLRILKLDAAASKDQTPLWKAVTKAREAGEPYVLDNYKWAVCSRATDAGIVFYLLVREPSAACAVTEEHLENVRLNLNTPPFSLTLYFKDPEGKDRLKEFTSANVPPKDGRRFLTVVVGNKAVVIAQMNNVLEQGRLELNGKFRESDLTDMERSLDRVLTKAPNGQ